jgi:hypothetical protein
MMKPMQVNFWLIPLSLWSGLALAAGGSGPGAMADGGMTDCGGMMMGGFMIVPMLGALLLFVTLILGILALIKYLRRG